MFGQRKVSLEDLPAVNNILHVINIISIYFDQVILSLCLVVTFNSKDFHPEHLMRPKKTSNEEVCQRLIEGSSFILVIYK